MEFPFNTMALASSDRGARRAHRHQMVVITSPLQGLLAAEIGRTERRNPAQPGVVSGLPGQRAGELLRPIATWSKPQTWDSS